MRAEGVAEERVEELLADAGEFFEAYLWESGSGEAARDRLAREKLDEEVIRTRGPARSAGTLAVTWFRRGSRW
jgi:hypothetical protein